MRRRGDQPAAAALDRARLGRRLTQRAFQRINGGNRNPVARCAEITVRGHAFDRRIRRARKADLVVRRGIDRLVPVVRHRDGFPPVADIPARKPLLRGEPFRKIRRDAPAGVARRVQPVSDDHGVDFTRLVGETHHLMRRRTVRMREAGLHLIEKSALLLRAQISLLHSIVFADHRLDGIVPAQGVARRGRLVAFRLARRNDAGILDMKNHRASLTRPRVARQQASAAR